MEFPYELNVRIYGMTKKAIKEELMEIVREVDRMDSKTMEYGRQDWSRFESKRTVKTPVWDGEYWLTT